MELTQSVATALSSTFSLDSYRALLTALKGRGYQFATFPGSAELLEQRRPFALMRHDIDFDLGAAEKIAEIEAEEGVVASYFVLLRTELYNLFSADGSAAVRRILDLGHQLGLHFDCAAYSPESTTRDLAEASDLEASILERWFGRKIDVISYHRPSKLVLAGDPDLSAPRTHTYMRAYTESIRYVSDSRGTWGHGSPTDTDAFQDGKPLHILTHPIWWVHENPSPYRSLLAYRDRKMDDLETAMARSCKVYRQGRFAGMTD